MQVFKTRPTFNFMSHRRGALIFSTVAVLLSLGSLFFRGLNYSVEFTGGVIIEAAYTGPADLQQIRKELEQGGLHDVRVQALGANDFQIRLPPPEQGADVNILRARVEDALHSQGESAEIRRFDTVGPQVGSELAQKSLLAVVFASLGIFLYVALRFRWKLSAGASGDQVAEPAAAQHRWLRQHADMREHRAHRGHPAARMRQWWPVTDVDRVDP